MAVTAALVLLVAMSFQNRAPVYDPYLLSWSEALKAWRHEADSAAVELARGVLFDCGAHRRDVDILFPPGRNALAGNSSCSYIGQTNCAKEAEAAFAKAVMLDPALLEARLRLAAARSERNAEGDVDLQSVFEMTNAPSSVRYLAAIFLGKSAHARHDADAAAGWFAKAAGIDGQWTVAPLLRAAVSNGPLIGLPSAAGSSPDPWYSYRCEVLTPSVRSMLSSWMARADSR